jgi:cytochrome c peroxidase
MRLMGTSESRRAGRWAARRVVHRADLGLALASAAALVLGCKAGEPTPPSQPPAAPGPIPVAGPLAAPKSLSQTGVPIRTTRAAAPADNPQTPGKIALGRKLFFDGRLSVDGTVACSSCHDPAHAFTDGRPVSIGVKGRTGQRNAPTILNALYNRTQFWDGRATTLEDQAAFPIVNPMEMGQPSLDAAVASIARAPEYQRAFRRVFHRAPNAPDLLRAIASYERSQVSFDAAFDRFMAGDRTAISKSAWRGWELFNTKARCNLCHAPSEKRRDATFFTDRDFHNIGIGILRYDVADLACQANAQIKMGDSGIADRAAISSSYSALGRFLLTRKEADIAAFKTPGLRNVLVTAPYFHDGSQQTLWDVIDHYNKGDGVHNPWLDPDIQPLALSEGEIDDLVAFLASLTSAKYEALGVEELARQREIAAKSRPQRDTARAFGPKPGQPARTSPCARYSGAAASG